MTPACPLIFDEFFASGKEESISPFLTPSRAIWGKNLSLKAAIFSAVLLLFAFITSFSPPLPSSSFCSSSIFSRAHLRCLARSEDLKNFEINIDVLMTFAALLSVVIGSEMEGALLLVLFELSGAIEDMVSQKTKGTALLNLHRLSPRFACMIDERRHFLRASRQRNPPRRPASSSKPERSSP